MKNPQTMDEWQEAADAAYAMLLIDSARQFGLIFGGPEVDRDRAVELLDGAEKLGIKPVPSVVDKYFRRRAFR